VTEPPVASTSVAATSAPLAREGRGRLPLPPVPKDRAFRPVSRIRRSLSTFVGVFGVLVGAGAASAVFGLPPGITWIAIGGWVSWVGWRVFKVRRFNRENSELVTHINQGDPGVLPALEDLCRRYKRVFSAHHVSVFNLGIARMMRGDLTEALSLFHAFRRAKAAPALGEVVGFHIATCHALLGDLAAADEWLDEASRRVRHAHRRADVIPRAILLLRRGDYAGAERFLADDWGRAESIYVGLLLHGLHALRAFAMVKAGRDPETDEVRALVGNAKLASFDLRFLVVDWPELRAFLVERGVKVG
jgi:hypothetical protein